MAASDTTIETPRSSTGPTSRSRESLGTRLGRWGAFALLALLAILWLAPIAWAVSTSLKPEGDTAEIPLQWIPDVVTLDAYRSVIDAGNLLRWYGNSFVVSGGVTIITVLITSLAAYGISRIPFRSRLTIFGIILAGIVLPGQILIIPLFIEVQALGLIDSYWGIILPQVAASVAVFIFKQFFDGIPSELDDAARLDGASPLRIYWEIWMPLARPAIAAVAIFTFIGAWNNFLLPFILITDPDQMTIPVGLAVVQSAYGIQYAQVMASAIIGGIPLVFIFLFFQRQIVQGVAGVGIR